MCECTLHRNIGFFDVQDSSTMRSAFSIILLLIGFTLHAGNFNFKLQVELVDHGDPSQVKVMVYEKGVLLATEEVDEKGDAKLKLTEGKLYDLRLVAAGYYPHVIHNVHAEGDGKVKLKLAKGDVVASTSGYKNVFRTFDDVKKMTIPAEYLEAGVSIVKEEDLTSEEQAELKRLEKLLKKQEKIQKKIDALNDDIQKKEDEIRALDEDMAEGKLEKLEGDQKKLDAQEELVKLREKVKKLAY